MNVKLTVEDLRDVILGRGEHIFVGCVPFGGLGHETSSLAHERSSGTTATV
jgi:hypothetical protein